MLATLSGCQKDLVAPNEFNPISRLEAEKLLKEWNADRKSTLKSAANITLSEKQWQKAKVYQNDSVQISVISVPLAQRLALCFEKGKQGTGMFFCEARPDSLYLTEKQGKVEPKNFTGYLILYNNEGKGVVAYRYVNGLFEDEYGVVPKQSLLKGVNDMNYIDEVVVTAKRPEKYHDENSPFIPNFPDLSKCFTKKDTDISIGIGIGTGGTSTNPTTNPNPTPEPKIDDEKLEENPCAKLAWNLLKTNYSFSNIIQKFVGNYTLLNISFEMVTNLKSRDDVKCDALISPLGNTYIISIDNSFASNSSTLEVARAITHEIIHAELNYFFYECGNNLTIFQQRYPDLYARWESYGFGNKALYQHEELNNFYRSEMKSILMNICPGYSSNVYDAVIWGGLTGTREWANLSPDEQNAIKAIVSEQRKAGSGNCSN